jgi:hypothetical protein
MSAVNPTQDDPTPDDVRDYIRFFFQVGRDSHPHEQFELRLKNKRQEVDAFQVTLRGQEDTPKVWLLLHGYLTNFYRTLVPYPLKIPIMFSPYMSMAAFRTDDSTQSEFPDVSEGDLARLVKEDTDAVYLLQARINGRGLTPVRMVGSADNVKIEKDNVLGIPDGIAKVYYNGYFVKLKPLPPGDHLIESKGYAPNFENDVRYSVYIRAGNFP